MIPQYFYVSSKKKEKKKKTDLCKEDIKGYLKKMK